MCAEQRQSARVVDVRMREHHRVDLRDGQRQHRVLLTRLGAPSLEHAAVQQHGLPIEAENMTGACDLASRAGKLDLHVATRKG
jgi:hypothetical protein